MSKVKINGMLDKSGNSLDLVDACMLSLSNFQTATEEPVSMSELMSEEIAYCVNDNEHEG